MGQLLSLTDPVSKVARTLYADQVFNFTLKLPTGTLLAISTNTAHELDKSPFVEKLTGDEQIDPTSWNGAEVHSSGLSPTDNSDGVGSHLAVLLGVKRRVDEGLLQPILVPAGDPFSPGDVH